MFSYAQLRPAIFLLPPEKAHRAAIRALQLGLVPPARFSHPSLESDVLGLHFANPVGLAPGFDKNAEAVQGAWDAGFGFAEIGTVTPRPQPGNPAPRLFRLPEHEAVINRLGFNNEGMEAAARRLRGLGARRGIVGGNIGKNKESTDALADYTAALRALYPYVDYITVNISSPNTPGLRNLQQGDELRALVRGVQAACEELVAAHGRRPVLVKIAPDNDAAGFESIAQVATELAVDGLIVSNTTIDRDAVRLHRHGGEAGGLSGKPLFAKSTEALRLMYTLTQGKIPLIGVGGISSAQDAYDKILAGASLVQLYTALIYQGFGLVEQIHRGLAELLARDGYATIRDAVGKKA